MGMKSIPGPFSSRILVLIYKSGGAEGLAGFRVGGKARVKDGAGENINERGGSLYTYYISPSTFNQLPLWRNLCPWFFPNGATWCNSWHPYTSSCLLYKLLHAHPPSFHGLSPSFPCCFLLWRPLFLTASLQGSGRRAGFHSYWFSSALGSRQVHSSRSQSAANGMTWRGPKKRGNNAFPCHASPFATKCHFSCLVLEKCGIMC